MFIFQVCLAGPSPPHHCGNQGEKQDRLMLGKQLAQFGLAAPNAKGLEKKA